MKAIKLDKETIRHRASQHLQEGPVTDSYTLDKKAVVEMLNDALATELVCVLRYRSHYQIAKSGRGLTIAPELLKHSNEELGHADLLAERISQLGEEPQFDPSQIATRSHTPFSTTKTDLIEILEEDLVAERIAIETYSQMIRYMGIEDPTTRRVLEEILAVEEEHADDLKSMLEKFREEGGPSLAIKH